MDPSLFNLKRLVYLLAVGERSHFWELIQFCFLEYQHVGCFADHVERKLEAVHPSVQRYRVDEEFLSSELEIIGKWKNIIITYKLSLHRIFFTF